MSEEKICYQKRIQALIQKMNQEEIDFYLLPMCDDHGSEYIGDYFKCIRYYSGFTGSAATMVVTKKEAYLWTDGRYFLQAENQLLGTQIHLMKQGEENVPTVSDFLVKQATLLGKKDCHIGFDGKLLDCRFLDVVEKKFLAKAEGIKPIFCYEADFAGQIWDEDQMEPREKKAANKVWILGDSYAGMSVKDKLEKVRQNLADSRADILLLTCLDEIAYLTNLRGDDVSYTPVFLSYMMISKENATLFIQEEALTEEVRTYLNQQGIKILEYHTFYDELEKIKADTCVQYDLASANYLLEKKIPNHVKRVHATSPVILMKAVKTKTEFDHEFVAHVKDGVAVTRFIYWLKTQVRTGKESATELSAAEKLEEYRKQSEHYLGQSFAPIMAYKEHGAIVHYSADEVSNSILGNESFLLSDTGGHYLEGTTDITRTIVMGELSAEQKKHYTAVLCGNLRLMNAVFKAGSQGANLDYLARQPLYQLGLDFNHGTGHGVGYLLNVHEGPNAFRQRPEEGAQLVEGMITSDEPGYYEDGKYGIRLENLIGCVKLDKTKYGQFMGFKPLTMVPFDLEAVDTKLMQPNDRLALNQYHKLVFDTISPFLSDEEKEWLHHETREI